MCGRFALISGKEAVRLLLPELNAGLWPVPRYNIAPAQDILTVLNDGRLMTSFAKWGLIPSWSKDHSMGTRLINARAETLAEKTSFRNPFKRQRCLIFANGFFEWDKNTGGKTKIPYYFKLKTGGLIALAGLWDRWKSPGGDIITSCTIITTGANSLVGRIHERMPVILPPEDLMKWIAPEEKVPEALNGLLKPCPPEIMESYAVSDAVNSPAHDDPVCVKPYSVNR
jgi:putative SOS response-associated peptidase YedK